MFMDDSVMIVWMIVRSQPVKAIELLQVRCQKASAGSQCLRFREKEEGARSGEAHALEGYSCATVI